jgi:type IV pilus assembly protein PilW
MRARGYTLIELVVALAISLIGVAAGMTLLIGSQQWFQTGSDERAMQETARMALDELQSSLRSAGYGLEPTMVFDMGILATTAQDRLPAGAGPPRFGGYGCSTGSCPGIRDSVDGPDELVFYARDPNWARGVLSVTGTTVTLKGNGKDPGLLPGQVLQVMCYGTNNQWLWAFVSVASIDLSDATKPAVTLKPSGAQAYDFPLQNAELAQGCYAAGTTMYAFKVDRFRYHVLAVDDDGTVEAWGTAGARPYLMLDQGLSDADGNPIDRVIAPDVEDLQVAYVYPLAPSGAQVLGATGAAVTANTAGNDAGFNLNPQAPFVIPGFGTAPADRPLARTSHHPANIRAVRVAITVRSPRKDIGVPDATVPAALNRPDAGGESGFRRMLFESTASTPNLESQFPVFPSYDPTAANTTSPCQTCPSDGLACHAGCTQPCVAAAAGNCGGG